MTDIDGAVVLVVGASGGLGSRLAGLLAAEGAVVVRGGRSPERLSGTDAYLADLRTPDGPASLVAAAVAAHGRLDGVVIAAGVVGFGGVPELSDETLDELVETNLLGPIRLIRAATPALAASAASGRKPFVVTLSGIVAEAPTAGMAAYSASKSGLAAFMTAASREYRRHGIRLLDARPGHTGTQLSEHPVAGVAPAFGKALDPDAVAARILEAVVDDEKDLPSTAF